MDNNRQNVMGAAFVVLGMFTFSFQNMAIKSISADYPVLQIVVFRSFVAIPAAYALMRLEGQRGWPVTTKPMLEFVRGMFMFLSYTTFFMGVAALTLAEAESIRFSGPLMITILTVFFFGERVGLVRWIALLVGFGGVLLIVQPGTASFNLGSVFVLIATAFYAFVVMLTRRLRNDDSSATMAFFGSLVYLVAAFIITPITMAIGNPADAHPSVAFLLREWTTPTFFDAFVMSAVGLSWAGGMYCIARAYTMAATSVATPFEYTSLPINAMWGFVIFNDVPTLLTLIGALLTIGSGLFILYRDQANQPTALHRAPLLEEGQAAD